MKTAAAGGDNEEPTEESLTHGNQKIKQNDDHNDEQGRLNGTTEDHEDPKKSLGFSKSLKRVIISHT